MGSYLNLALQNRAALTRSGLIVIKCEHIHSITREDHLHMFCTNCGAQNEPGTAFCTRCGSRLAAEVASPAVDAVPPLTTGQPPPPPIYAPSGGPIAQRMDYATWASRVIAYLIDTLLVGGGMLVLYLVAGTFLAGI